MAELLGVSMQLLIAGGFANGGQTIQEDEWVVYSYDKKHNKLKESKDFNISTGPALVFVADGSGGEDGSNFISQTIVEQGPLSFQIPVADPKKAFEDALDTINSSVSDKKKEDPRLSKTTATFVGGYFHSDGLQLASVGNCHVYRFRDREIHQIGHEHRYDAELDLAAIQSDHPDAWTQVLGSDQRLAMGSAITGDPVRHWQNELKTVETGDIYLFVTDGIDLLSSEHLRRMVPSLGEKNVANVIAGLLDAIDHHGRVLHNNLHDSVSIVCVRVQEVDAQIGNGAETAARKSVNIAAERRAFPWLSFVGGITAGLILIFILAWTLGLDMSYLSGI
ncbi:MAG: protein phosphatase 2C domain-containing protein [Cohaesibacteraceae bacterium]|nr:protein phosphatase 2C domain-containing protein [Cohaesibacteraceae bacterium]